MRVLTSCVLSSVAAFSVEDVDGWFGAAAPAQMKAQMFSLLALGQNDYSGEVEDMSARPPPPQPISRACGLALERMAGPPPAGGPKPEDVVLVATKICKNTPQECQTGVSDMGFRDAEVLGCLCSFALDDEFIDLLYMMHPDTAGQKVAMETQKMVNQVSHCHLKNGKEAEEQCATLQAPAWSALGQCKADGDSVALSGTFMVEEPIAASLAIGGEACLPKTCHALLGKAMGVAKAAAKQGMHAKRPPQVARFLAEAPEQELNLATLQALEDFDPVMLLATNASQPPGAPAMSPCQQKLQAVAGPFMQKCVSELNPGSTGPGDGMDTKNIGLCMLKSGLPEKLCTVECPEPEGGLLKCACAVYAEKKAMIAKATASQQAMAKEMMQLQMNVMSQADACILSGNEKACAAAQHGAKTKLEKCSTSGDVCTAALQLTTNMPGAYSAGRVSTQLSMCLPKVCHAPVQTMMAVVLERAKGQQERMDPFTRMMTATAEKFPVHCGVHPAQITVGKKPVWHGLPSGPVKFSTSSTAIGLVLAMETAGSAVAVGTAGLAAVMVAGAAVITWRRRAHGVRS